MSWPLVRLAALGAAIAGAVVAVVVLPHPDLDQVRQLRPAGALGTLVVVVGVAVGTALMVPRAAIAIGMGLLYSPLPGTLCTLAGVVLGATLAFGLGRGLARPYVAGLLERPGWGRRLGKVDAWVARHGWWGVLYSRFIPVLPFSLINYTLGVTRLPVGAFVVGTAVGIAPSTALYVTLGTSVANPTSPAFLLTTGVALLLAVVASVSARAFRGSAARARATVEDS